MILQDARFDLKTIDYDPSMAEKKVAKALKNMLPVFVAGEIIVAHVEVQEGERLQKRIYG